MRQEKNSPVRRIELWTNYHPPGMRYFSIFDGQFIKQESGRPAHKHNKWFLLHRIMHITVSETWLPIWMTIAEVSRSCRELFKCSCKRDCSNFKCEKQMWIVPHYASATVLNITVHFC